MVSIFYFHPYLGKVPILTNFIKLGWNHQPVLNLYIRVIFHNIHPWSFTTSTRFPMQIGRSQHLKRTQVCPKQGIGPPTFLFFFGWDWNPQSYSGNGFGFLGIHSCYGGRFTSPTFRTYFPSSEEKLWMFFFFFGPGVYEMSASHSHWRFVRGYDKPRLMGMAN